MKRLLFWLPSGIKSVHLGYAIFFFWFIVLGWCLIKSAFIRQSGLSVNAVLGLFCIKVIAGLLMGRMVQYAVPIVDTWGFHKDGLIEYRLLFQHPGEYFTNLFHSIYTDKYGGVFVARNSFWNDLRGNLMAKFMSVLDLLSFGHYYVNVVLFNFLVLFGNLALYRVFQSVYPQQKQLLIVSCFLLPSFLLYTSTIHKDGIILAAIGTILFLTMRMLQGAWNAKRLLLVLGCLLLVFFLRNLVALSLVPALISLIAASKMRIKPVFAFAVIYGVGLGLFFLLPAFIPALDFPGYIAQRQADFIGLGRSNTTIAMHVLEPSFSSFMHNAPQALVHSLARPFISDAKLSILLVPFSIELLVYAIILLTFLKSRNSWKRGSSPVVLFGIFLSLSICLVIGYTTPILGAIVRYRAIYFPFLISPLICNVKWPQWMLKYAL